MTTPYITKLNEVQFKKLSDNWLITTVYWCINSKYRKTKRLDKFLSEQIKYHQDLIKEGETNPLIDLSYSLRGANPYQFVANVEKWVYQHITYLSDIKNYGMIDFWAEADQVLSRKMGDCNSQNSLIHILLRIGGIHKNNLYGVIGDADGNGTIDHYWTLFFDSCRNRWVRLDSTYDVEIKQIYKKSEFKIGKEFIPHYVFNELGIRRYKNV